MPCTNELAQFPTPRMATLILSLLIHITLATIRFIKNIVLIEKVIKPAKRVIQNTNNKIQDKCSNAYDLQNFKKTVHYYILQIFEII